MLKSNNIIENICDVDKEIVDKAIVKKEVYEPC